MNILVSIKTAPGSSDDLIYSVRMNEKEAKQFIETAAPKDICGCIVCEAAKAMQRAIEAANKEGP